MSYPSPPRRAVVKVVRGDGNVGFGKVLRPASPRELVERHRILQEANVGAPRVILSNDDGLVLSSNLPGEPLAKSSVSRDEQSVPRWFWRNSWECSILCTACGTKFS